MKRWSIKELNSLDEFSFAKAVLIERRGSLLPSSPLFKKLSDAAAELEAAADRERKCFSCEEDTCAYNFKAQCRFARINEAEPLVIEGVGCQDVVYV